MITGCNGSVSVAFHFNICNKTRVKNSGLFEEANVIAETREMAHRAKMKASVVRGVLLRTLLAHLHIAAVVVVEVALRTLPNRHYVPALITDVAKHFFVELVLIAYGAERKKINFAGQAQRYTTT